jgi:hypothetical protein
MTTLTLCHMAPGIDLNRFDERKHKNALGAAALAGAQTWRQWPVGQRPSTFNAELDIYT